MVKKLICWIIIFLPVIIQVGRIIAGKFDINLLESDNFSLYIWLWMVVSSFLLIARYKIKALLITLIIGLTCFGIEAFFYIQLKYFDKPTVFKYSICRQADGLGYMHRPDISVTGEKTIAGEVIYSGLPIHIDNKGRRFCKNAIAKGEEHALFFGASFVFGEGYPAWEALPCMLETVSKGKYKSYNYGVSGWGCGQMLELLHQRQWFSDVTPRNGIAVYAFIGDHVFRSTGKNAFLSSHKTFPYYDLDENEKLVGPFHWKNHKPWRNYIKAIKRLRAVSPTITFFSHRDFFHPVSTEKAIAISAKIISESKELYEKMFDGEFIVMIWPRMKLKQEWQHQLFMKYMNQNKIKTLVIPEMSDPKKAILHKYDVHPSASEHKWVAQHLWEYLKKNTDENK